MSDLAPGSLVSARGREWVVLPESDPDLLVLRPLGGSDDEIAGVIRGLEEVTPASILLPDPVRDLGSHTSSGLLRDAARLGFRSAAGPFRCLARIQVDPRPYQMVPLLMALRQEVVRLLIADDVGIGKTVEALVIARELLDRGEIRSFTVLCPPHLAEQWQRAMRDQFNLDATLVLPATASRLERGLGLGESLFERHRFTVVSMDWIKSERRRHEFQRVCPELVIVDEAHGCAAGGVGRGSQQRHDLLRILSQDKERHLILVTATPHSGKEDDFRSLLRLLEPELGSLPENLAGEENREHRETLATFMVQRRRADLRAYLDAETRFPERLTGEEPYVLSAAYSAFFRDALEWARARVFEKNLDKGRQRVRWWSALALLRAIGSSPAAAAATLLNRAAGDEEGSGDEADAVGRRLVLDLDDEPGEGADVVAGTTEERAVDAEQERMRKLAGQAASLAGAHDRKLHHAAELLATMLAEGWSPIVFCRYIPTVEYLATHLRKALGGEVHVEAITGILPPEEREQRVQETLKYTKRVLVCTDCLSEGINLQNAFDAVVHYDLAWNPTRHEQREGRVDRFGQEREKVRALTLYGRDNPVDGLILDVLLRKHRTIHRQLGITVPVPTDTGAVVEAMMEALLLRRQAKDVRQAQLAFPIPASVRQTVEIEWSAAVDRESRSRTIFRQASIKVEEVARELAEARRAIGGAEAVEDFVRQALGRMGLPVSKAGRVDLSRAPSALRDALGAGGVVDLAFRPPTPRGALSMHRTHPFVSGLAAYVLEAAIDPKLDGPARRCGVIHTRAVDRRTALLLLRLRFHIVHRDASGAERELLAEDLALVAFQGSPSEPVWLDDAAAEALLSAEPLANVPDDVKQHHLKRILEREAELRPHLNSRAQARGEALLDAHRRVRKAGRLKLRSLRVVPYLPVDVLGLFVYLPGGSP